jgi:hypothetical protein
MYSTKWERDCQAGLRPCDLLDVVAQKDLFASCRLRRAGSEARLVEPASGSLLPTQRAYSSETKTCVAAVAAGGSCIMRVGLQMILTKGRKKNRSSTRVREQPPPHWRRVQDLLDSLLGFLLVLEPSAPFETGKSQTLPWAHAEKQTQFQPRMRALAEDAVADWEKEY